MKWIPENLHWLDKCDCRYNWKPDKGFQILQFGNCLSFKLQVEVLIAINMTVLVYVGEYMIFSIVLIF